MAATAFWWRGNALLFGGLRANGRGARPLPGADGRPGPRAGLCVFNPFPRRPHRRACLAGGFGLHRHGGGCIRHTGSGGQAAAANRAPSKPMHPRQGWIWPGAGPGTVPAACGMPLGWRDSGCFSAAIIPSTAPSTRWTRCGARLPAWRCWTAPTARTPAATAPCGRIFLTRCRPGPVPGSRCCSRCPNTAAGQEMLLLLHARWPQTPLLWRCALLQANAGAGHRPNLGAP